MSLPDWLVERAALDELGPQSRDRVEHAEPGELAERVAALRQTNAAELARYPAGPAVAQIEARVAQLRRRRQQRLRWLGLAGSTLSLAVVALLVIGRPAVDGGGAPGSDGRPPTGSAGSGGEITRIKGGPRLLAFRQAGAQAEELDADAMVRAGDAIQLRFNPGKYSYGVIASVDGAGVVTLHYPLSEDAPPRATAMPQKTTALPHAYALDDAPRFERFFFITANDPVDVQRTLTALHLLAGRGDSATATLTLPDGMDQSTLRLRKPDRNTVSTHHESP